MTAYPAAWCSKPVLSSESNTPYPYLLSRVLTGWPALRHSRGLEMAQSYKERSSLKGSLVELAWKLVALAALAGCTLLGWYIFELARENRFASAFGDFYRFVSRSLQIMFRLDPVLALIVFPFAIVVVMILIGLLVWLHKDR